MSEFVSHVPCENCGSSDANSLFTDGHQYCFSCQAYVAGEDQAPREERSPMSKSKSKLLEFGNCQAIPTRNLLKETCEKYGYHVTRDEKNTLVQVASYRNSSTSGVVAQKVRYADKSFRSTGEMKGVQLFGQHLWPNGGKYLVVTEGEIDAMSASQMSGGYAAVSVPSGAQGAARAFKDNLDYLESFEGVFLCFDMDEPGRKAAAECAEILSPGRARLMELPLKDANEMLKANRVGEFTKAFWDAKPFQPDGIVNGADLWDIVNTAPAMGIPFPWVGLTNLTYGQRQGELWTWTSGTGMGKSEFVAEIAYHLLMQGESVGYVALEEGLRRSGQRMMSKHLSRPIHLPGVESTEEERRSAFEATTGSGRFFMYDHWGSQESDKLLAKIRYLIKSSGCTTIILDHLSIIVSGLDDGDERKAIDVTMTKLRSLVEETGVKMHLVSHLRRPSGDKGHENGAEVTLSQLRGSHSIVQLSDFVVGLERDQQGDTADVSLIRVLKNRYSGKVGKACAVHYSHETGRLTEVDMDSLEGDGPKGAALFDGEHDDF